MTDMQILPNCLYVVAHGSSRTTVCVEGMHKSCAALTLHTGVLSKSFVTKSCRNPARHIFSWLPGEAVGLHTGVLTKTFAMSLLYLKSELNYGLGDINGEDASMAGGHGSQRARFPVSLRSVQLARFSVNLHSCTPLGQPAHRTTLARLPFSQGQVAVRTTPPTAIKTKTRGIT